MTNLNDHFGQYFETHFLIEETSRKEFSHLGKQFALAQIS